MNNKLQLTNHERPVTSDYFSNGSALILTVVLTTLLATVGVLFVLLSRIDKMAASAASENRQLNLAVDTVVAKISQELVLDVPGVVTGKEYYDYPGTEDEWLASIEPYDVDARSDVNDYRWQQISDVTEFLRSRGVATQYVKVNPPGNRKVINEYPEIKLAINGELDNGNPDDGRLNNELRGQLADADGDGIADSKWVQLYDITSSKGKPIYAAIRVIDNGGMLNVNTAYKFNPDETDPNLIDGSNQMQINLAGLVRGSDNVDQLHIARCGSGSSFWIDFQNNVIWRIEYPVGGYLPFDISDELELRYRYCIDSKFKSRIEINIPDTTDAYGDPGGLYDASSGWGLEDWQHRITEPNYSSKTDRRHLLNTYNMDRIIRPDGIKMVNVNTADVDSMYNAIRKVLTDALAAQIAVNIKDYRDADSDVTTYGGYYGFETPCVYISELVHNFTQRSEPPPPTVFRSYAVELYKPYSEDASPVGWRLVVGGTPINIDNWSNARQFYVIRNQNSNAPLGYIPYADIEDSNALTFSGGIMIELQRPIIGGGYITVDSKQVPAASANWLVTDNRLHSIERDIYNKQYLFHKCIRRLWNPAATTDATLGRENTYNDSSTDLIQAHPANKPFTNIGEIGMIFVKSAYSQGPNPIGQTDNEFTARLNLINPAFQQIFNYLTVFDPAAHGQPSSETRIKGRININTAPWYVIAELPWISLRKGGYYNTALAQAIVAYRDTTAKKFKSIGELMNVAGMDYYAVAPELGDLTGFPDLTPGGSTGDGAADDFEERDVIFSRISNLVTVRSDVFTAYILVRIGANGPQRRVVAILDRSRVPEDKVKILALQLVPDPR